MKYLPTITREPMTAAAAAGAFLAVALDALGRYHAGYPQVSHEPREDRRNG